MNAKKLLNNPDYLFFFLSLFIFIFYLLNSDFVYISIVTFSHFFIFSIVFFFSFRFFSIFFSSIAISIKPFLPAYFLYAIAISLTLYSLYKLTSFLMANSLTSLMMLRSSVAGSEAKISLGVGLSFPFCLAAWYISKLNESKYSILFICLALLLALMSTTKIFLFVIVFYLLFFSNVNMVRILISVFVLLAVFFLSHLLLEKFSSNPDDGVVRALWNTLLVYMFGGIAAFQNILIGSVQLEQNIMLSSIKGIVSVFGIDNVPVSPILPWTKVGNWNTNVYTAFGYWYSLIGHFYLFISPLILGFYYALFFSPKKPFIMFDFYKPFLLFCLTFIYMGDQYLPAFLMHFIYISISIIVSITKVEEERN